MTEDVHVFVRGCPLCLGDLAIRGRPTPETLSACASCRSTLYRQDQRIARARAAEAERARP